MIAIKKPARTVRSFEVALGWPTVNESISNSKPPTSNAIFITWGVIYDKGTNERRWMPIDGRIKPKPIMKKINPKNKLNALLPPDQ